MITRALYCHRKAEYQLLTLSNNDFDDEHGHYEEEEDIKNDVDDKNENVNEEGKENWRDEDFNIGIDEKEGMDISLHMNREISLAYNGIATALHLRSLRSSSVRDEKKAQKYYRMAWQVRHSPLLSPPSSSL